MKEELARKSGAHVPRHVKTSFTWRGKEPDLKEQTLNSESVRERSAQLRKSSPAAAGKLNGWRDQACER